jgi:hypothetical protein
MEEEKQKNESRKNKNEESKYVKAYGRCMYI